MTDCRVICRQCRDDTPLAGPKIWRYLCVDCGEDQVARHRRATGHTDLELRIAADAPTGPTISALTDRIVNAGRAWR